MNKETAAGERAQDRLVDEMRAAAKRFGVRHVTSRMMGGRRIWFPTEWDSDREQRQAERDARVERLRRELRG